MKPNAAYKAALYMRLSKDDDAAAESASITTQRRILKSYAAENGFPVFGEYVDDGWSGTNFERPGFKRMIADIEAKKIDLVLTKDLSRLGRDHIMTGQYTEIYFPSRNVRYIAVNDGYDSDSPYTDIAPFKNVINEMYARDTSRKIRSAFVARMKDGAYIGAFAPYGYRKDPLDKHRLLPDGPAAEVVKELFRMAANGASPAEIARGFNARGIPPPAVYRCRTREGLDVAAYSRRREWTGATVGKMLRSIVYLGHTAQGKTTKVSFKSDITVNNPKDEWFIVEHTHEPLVDAGTFELAGRRMAARACGKKGEFRNLFSGIARCADCGRNMSATGTRKKGSPANLTCGGYKLYGGGACTNHFIDYNVLCGLVLASLKEQLRLSTKEREEIIRAAREKRRPAGDGDRRAQELAAARRRSRELDGIIEKLYEDYAQGLIGDARRSKLLQRYEREAEEIGERFKQLEKADEEAQPFAQEPYEAFAARLRKVTDLTELTPQLVYKLIDHIEIGQGGYEKTEQGRVKRQQIKIFYRFQTEAALRQYAL